MQEGIVDYIRLTSTRGVHNSDPTSRIEIKQRERFSSIAFNPGKLFYIAPKETSH